MKAPQLIFEECKNNSFVATHGMFTFDTYQSENTWQTRCGISKGDRQGFATIRETFNHASAKLAQESCQQYFEEIFNSTVNVLQKIMTAKKLLWTEKSPGYYFSEVWPFVFEIYKLPNNKWEAKTKVYTSLSGTPFTFMPPFIHNELKNAQEDCQYVLDIVWRAITEY